MFFRDSHPENGEEEMRRGRMWKLDCVSVGMFFSGTLSGLFAVRLDSVFVTVLCTVIPWIRGFDAKIEVR